MGTESQAAAAELFEQAVGLCNKVAVDAENGGHVRMSDLVELRDAINDIRKAVAGGGGYKMFPRIVRTDEDARGG